MFGKFFPKIYLHLVFVYRKLNMQIQKAAELSQWDWEWVSMLLWMNCTGRTNYLAFKHHHSVWGLRVPETQCCFFQSLLLADFQLPGKELGWEKRNLSFDPIAQTFITVLFFSFTTHRTKSGKIRKKIFQKRHVLYLISIERRVGDRNVIIPKL